MKIIVISGSYSKIGKSTLAFNIARKLAPLSVETIKIGHNPARESKNIKLFHKISEGLEYIEQLKIKNITDYLIIESNSILEYIDADLVIFLRNYEKPEKETSKIALQKTDILIDENFNPDEAKKRMNQKLSSNSFLSCLNDQFNYMFTKKEFTD